MPDWMEIVGGWIIQISTVGAAVIVVWRWFAKPLGRVNDQLVAVNQRLDVIQDDNADLICDRLTQAHDYHMRKGYCSQGDKSRLISMHSRYRCLGRNHLAESYERDILGLPEYPEKRSEKS